MTERITAAAFKARKPAKKSKYGNKRVTVDGIKFDSKREAGRWVVLCRRLSAGEIIDLKRQVKIPLLGRDDGVKTPTGRQAHYIADFTYTDLTLNGVHVIEDAKGFPTKEYLLKRAILSAQGVEIEET